MTLDTDNILTFEMFLALCFAFLGFVALIFFVAFLSDDKLRKNRWALGIELVLIVIAVGGFLYFNHRDTVVKQEMKVNYAHQQTYNNYWYGRENGYSFKVNEYASQAGYSGGIVLGKGDENRQLIAKHDVEIVVVSRKTCPFDLKNDSVDEALSKMSAKDKDSNAIDFGVEKTYTGKQFAVNTLLSEVNQDEDATVFVKGESKANLILK